jgi:hypothetical protein
VVTFDDATGSYRVRAYNDGRCLQTEVKLLDDDSSLSWGFAPGEMTTNSVLRINENREWTELCRADHQSETSTKARSLLSAISRK